MAEKAPDRAVRRFASLWCDVTSARAKGRRKSRDRERSCALSMGIRDVVDMLVLTVTKKRPNLRLARDPRDRGGASTTFTTSTGVKRRMPRAGSTRALTPGDVHRLLEQLADVVTAVKEVMRASTDPHARRRLEMEVRPMVFAGNCLWAAADGWQEHEALVDLQKYGPLALDRVLQMRDGTGQALDAAGLFRAEHALRALVTTVIDDIDTSLAGAGATPPQAETRSRR
jgi:hypothetical protein